MRLDRAIALTRRKIIENLLPDVCKIRAPSNVTGVSIYGVLTRGAVVYRTYTQTINGVEVTSEDIPCRMDISRAFRPASLKVQAVVDDEYELELPYDMAVSHSDIIEFQGRDMRVRKLKDVSELDGTLVLLVSFVSVLENN